MSNGSGNCYEVHATAMIYSNITHEREGWLLCHADITPIIGKLKGVTHSHCWLEKDGVVNDISNGGNTVMDAEFYYMLAGINSDDVKRYTGEEALFKMGEYGHYGPWDERFPPIV